MSDILILEIENLRNIKKAKFELPIERGISVLTGENGSGKSTIMSLLATLFNQYQITDFSELDISRSTNIKMSVNEKKLEYRPTSNGKSLQANGDKLPLHGFFEGSIIHGTRFRDTTIKALRSADNVNPKLLVKADAFVSENLGLILHNDANYYPEIFRIRKKEIAQDLLFLKNVPYFFKNNENYINQFHMSTGECLLISLLHLLNNTVIRRGAEYKNTQPYLVLIDEIELALHPSAITRLINFLGSLTEKENVCILFSSHSIEVIRRVQSKRIFYIAYNSGNLLIETPCFPAYVTRDIYTTDGFDFLFLVEDDLAKYIIENIINENRLYNNRLIQILPCGGWSQVLSMNMDIYKSKLAGPQVSIICVLDGDIKDDVSKFENANQEYKFVVKNYLPIKSIEKYLLENIINTDNYAFKKEFFDRFIRLTSSSDVIQLYKSKYKKDTDGKLLFEHLSSIAIKEGSNEKDIRRLFCEFIYRNVNFDILKEFLKSKLEFK